MDFKGSIVNTQNCERLILDYALAIDDPEGRSTIWAALRGHLWEAGETISDHQLHSALHGMRDESLIELRKFADALGFVDFADYPSQDKFFHGEFRIRATYVGVKHCEKLKASRASVVGAVASSPEESKVEGLSSKQPFSKRHGYRPPAKEIRVREDAPENLRHFVLDAVKAMGFAPSDIRIWICSILHVRPDPSNWSEYPNVWGEVQDLVYGCDWFKFYDFVEEVYRRLSGGTGENALARPAQFQGELNEFFIDEGIGWQMVGGQIVTRGTETFESVVHEAAETLQASGRTTASGEIHEAFRDLSRRPKADLTGAVQHAMAALECVARDICNDERATLGEIIKRYPGTIPKPLDDAIAKAWGYASESARHIREGQAPGRREAELVVSLSAAVAIYLSRP